MQIKFEKDSFFVQTFLKSFCILFLTEVLFKLITFGSIFDVSTIRIFLFTLAISAFFSAVCSFLPKKAGRIIMGIFCWVYVLYALYQMGIHNMMGYYGSLKQVNMIGRVRDYIIPFFANLKPQYLLVLAPPVLIWYFTRKKKPEKEKNLKLLAAVIAASIIVYATGVWTAYAEGFGMLYTNPRFIEPAVKEFGLGVFGYKDISSAFIQEHIAVPDSSKTEKQTNRLIDDSEWIKAMEQESDPTFKDIDRYLMNRPISSTNEMTGVLKGKNLIYIMVEAFDYMAIDPELTPTLYKVMEEGWDFTNHYTPRYNCTTGTTEFISELSLIPESDVCSINERKDNAYPESLFNLFIEAGYETQAYHNWKDEFYERRDIYASEGCTVYENYEDLPYSRIQGWQSDLEMMELTSDKWIDEEKFMTLYVTSGMHFPYAESSTLGDRYLKEIDSVHPDYPIEVKRYLSKAMDFDKAVEYLLNQLEEKGKLDDTAIVIFGDHHPLNTDLDLIADYTFVIDKRGGLNEDRGPMFIYSPALGAKKLDEVTSSFDRVPTVANLYGLHYDPRLYMGTDYFGDEEKIVLFTNGNWVSEKGIYYSLNGVFEPFDGEADEEYVKRINDEVQNRFNVSTLISRTDYFRKRQFLKSIKYVKKTS